MADTVGANDAIREMTCVTCCDSLAAGKCELCQRLAVRPTASSALGRGSGSIVLPGIEALLLNSAEQLLASL